MKIFVTGGGGFIGSSLILHLQKEHEVTCFGHGSNYSELKQLFGKRVRFVDGEINDRKLLNREMNGMDAVVHLAGPAGNNACMKDPAKATMAHAVGTHAVLQEAISNNVEKFLFASTQSVYTTYKKRKIPFTEDMTLEPDDFYATLKAMAEYEIQDSEINYSILRFANVYGYGSGLFMSKVGGAIGNFIKAAFDGSEIAMYGEGGQGIDYVHVNDVCNAVEIILDKNAEHEIFNIGSGSLITIAQLAEKVSKLAKSVLKNNVAIKKLPAPEGSIWPDRLMSIKKVNAKIGWKPSTSIDRGIEEMLNKGVSK